MSFNFKGWNSFDPPHKTSKFVETQLPHHGSGFVKQDDKHGEPSPPSYNDIGKKARDLFNSGYHLGVLSLDIKTRSSNNIEIATSWSENMDENRLYGTVEAKCNLTEYNLSLTEKLNKNCFLNTELAYKNKLFNGLTLSLGGSLSPRTGFRMGLVKMEWSNRFASFNSDFEMGKHFAFLTSSLVLGHRGTFAGFQWRYDVHNDRQASLNFAAGHSTDEIQLNTWVNNGSECGGSIYHRVAPQLEMGVDLKWWTRAQEPLCGVAARYHFDKDIAVRGKINNNSELGFSYEQKLSDGITLTMSTGFDLRNLVVGNQKFGLTLSLDL